jgi:hypothetical protein
VLILGSSNNVVGGVGAKLRNVISGNSSAGIQILNTQLVSDPSQPFDTTEVTIGPAANNSLINNLIGTSADGFDHVGNQQGVFVNDAPNTIIGGAAAGAGNVISGNRSVGLQVLGPGASGTVVLGNVFGATAVNDQPLPNGSDVFVFASASNMSQAAIQAGNTVPAVGVRFRPLSAGPTVESVVPQTVSGGAITGLTLTFTMYLDRTRADMTSNYQVMLLSRNLRPLATIPVASATYNGIYRTVALSLGQSIPAGANFVLRVIGTSPNGLTDTSGNPLDGNQSRFRVPTGSDNFTYFRQGQPFQPSAETTLLVSRTHAIKLTHPRGHARPRAHGHRH